MQRRGGLRLDQLAPRWLTPRRRVRSGNAPQVTAFALVVLLAASCSGGGGSLPGPTSSSPVASSISRPTEAPGPPTTRTQRSSTTAVSPEATTVTTDPADSPTATPSSPSSSAASPGGEDCKDACYGEPQPLGDVPEEVAGEVSGIAVSHLDPEVIFAVDDAAGEHSIAVLRGSKSLGEIAIRGMDAANAEALTNGPCSATSSKRCLYVGDIGDHSTRESVTIYRIIEPDPDNLPQEPVEAAAWIYTYSDGPTNAEALMVVDDGGLIVVSKPEDDGPHQVYRADPGGGVFEPVASFDLPKPADPLQSLFVGNVVTDASRSADKVLLITYDQAIEYTAPTPGAEPAEFPDWPHTEVPMPLQPQSEAVGYRPDCGYVVASEGGPVDEVRCDTP